MGYIEGVSATKNVNHVANDKISLKNINISRHQPSYL